MHFEEQEENSLLYILSPPEGTEKNLEGSCEFFQWHTHPEKGDAELKKDLTSPV